MGFGQYYYCTHYLQQPRWRWGGGRVVGIGAEAKVGAGARAAVVVGVEAGADNVVGVNYVFTVLAIFSVIAICLSNPPPLFEYCLFKEFEGTFCP